MNAAAEERWVVERLTVMEYDDADLTFKGRRFETILSLERGTERVMGSASTRHAWFWQPLAAGTREACEAAMRLLEMP